jgi:4-hydroxy-tetrahydrodipicolinate synthase
MLGHKVGGLRLPLIEADEHELAAVREMLIRHGLLTGTTSGSGANATASSTRTAHT